MFEQMKGRRAGARGVGERDCVYEWESEMRDGRGMRGGKVSLCSNRCGGRDNGKYGEPGDDGKGTTALRVPIG